MRFCYLPVFLRLYHPALPQVFHPQRVHFPVQGLQPAVQKDERNLTIKIQIIGNVSESETKRKRKKFREWTIMKTVRYRDTNAVSQKIPEKRE